MDKLVIFQDKKIRRAWHNNEWYFSVVDIAGALSESDNPSIYWRVLKHREPQLVTICNGLKMPAEDGKYRLTDCVNTKSAFRLIQSIPSPKAEPFKLWLAQVGYERIEEIQDPELAVNRIRSIYIAKGYPENWIEKRISAIHTRHELTDEWKKRDVSKEDYAILTNEINQAIFGKSVSEHMSLKSLKKQNLRDHMTDLELIFNMLGEASTATIARAKDVRGFQENKDAASQGGGVAGIARKELEQRSGQPVPKKENNTEKPKQRRII